MGDMARQVFVESGVGMAFEAGAAVWSFDADLWGDLHQGADAAAALAGFATAHGDFVVMEAIVGDERAFARDLVPATDAELRRTQRILDAQRHRALRLLGELPPLLLDRDDPDRRLPPWATWRTARATLQHIADTESRYYLPQCGLASRPSSPNLRDELIASHRHVQQALLTAPRDLMVEQGGELWTTTKLLRRLAWHERGELDAVDALVATWATADDRDPSGASRAETAWEPREG